MLEDVVATKVSQVEAAGKRELGTGPDGLREEKSSIRVLDVEPAQHAVCKGLEVEVLAVAREVAMVGQSVEARAGTTGYVKGLVPRTETVGNYVCRERLTVTWTWGDPLLRDERAGG